MIKTVATGCDQIVLYPDGHIQVVDELDPTCIYDRRSLTETGNDLDALLKTLQDARPGASLPERIGLDIKKKDALNGRRILWERS